MPMVQIVQARGALISKQKQALLRDVQHAVVAVEGEALRAGAGVILEETLESPDSAFGFLPFVRVKLIRDALPDAQRADMLARVIEPGVAVEADSRRAIGGNPLTLEALSALRQGRNPWKA